MRYPIETKYNKDTDNPIYTIFDSQSQTFEEVVVPREDSYSYFLQQNMTKQEIREILREMDIDSLTRVVEIVPITKHNLFTDEDEVLMKVKMEAAMDVKTYRFNTCHEGHIKRITRHMLDKKWYMGMPCDDNNQLIPVSIKSKYKDPLIAMGYPEDVVDQFLGFMFADIPEISTMSLDIETESFGTVLPNPMYASTPIISSAFKFHDVITNETTGIVVLLEDELRQYVNKDINYSLRELVIQGRVKLEIYKTEYDLVMRIIEIIKDPRYPLCVTYFGEGFDLPYIYNRAINLGINRNRIPFTAYRSRTPQRTRGARTDWRVKMNNKMHIDLLQFFSQPTIQNYVFKNKYKKLGLDPVARGLIGRGKVEHEESINDLSMSNLAYYNYIDADITLDLMKQSDYLPLKITFMFMRIGRQGYYDAAHRAIGTKILNMAQGYMVERNILIPNRSDLSVVGTAHSSPDVKGKGYRGAIVIPTEKGLFVGIKRVDFASLYPTMMKEKNISFDTVNCNHPECRVNLVPELPHHICTKKIGIIPTLIGCLKDTRLLFFKPWSNDKSLPEKERNTYKAIEQALKVYVNASYGVSGFEGFGLFCEPVAESITAWSRDAITRLAIETESLIGNDLRKIAEEHGVDPLDALEYIPREDKLIISGDTDSLMGKFTEEQIEHMIKFSQEVLDTELALEITAALALFYKKKNYILVEENGNVEVKGMLGKKRNTPPIAVQCFEKFKTILVDVVTKDEPIDGIREKTVDLIREFYDMIWEGKGDIKDYVFEVKMTKAISEYKASPQHVKAAKKWAKHVRKNSTSLRTASDNTIVPVGSIIGYVKKAEGGVKTTRSGKRASGVKCDPIPIQIATKKDISPIYYHENLLSVMGQVMDALEINREEVITTDPSQSTLDTFF